MRRVIDRCQGDDCLRINTHIAINIGGGDMDDPVGRNIHGIIYVLVTDPTQRNLEVGGIRPESTSRKGNRRGTCQTIGTSSVTAGCDGAYGEP